ncbi:adenosylcobinamide-phosphate synthase CbiB [Brevibacillus dissolubilis]|uniref:adenosylcobinamide-phosphate synthase CbiB n=1 Tax=Brevibacillus dissolubilis TaxID=1844116 RepID=UPI0011173B72|nr:adenosylcobinamide-phosphate synthase CbiB [Brevibacillus dissolubilis]
MHSWFPLTVLLAYILDLIIGDPRWLPHPVIGMGKLITRVDRLIRPIYESLKRKRGEARWLGRLLGLLFPIVLVSTAFLIPFWLLYLLNQFSPVLAAVTEVFLIATTIATKGLAQAGQAIYQELIKGDLPQARFQLSMVVGRDTDQLDEKEITRGAVETVAENIVDAVTAPLLFALIGGAPLALAYRAVNTLDSMVGYKNEKYRDLGWASARLDDIFNFFPSRITFLFVIIFAWCMRLDAKGAWKMGLRDARKHPSPNSGWTESSVAGALRIQLGGVNYYQGVESNRARMGEPYTPLVPRHIRDTIRLHIATTAGYMLVGVLIVWLTRTYY